jgi:hypothetical protein
MALETVGDSYLLRTAGKKLSSPKAFSNFFLEGAKLIAPTPIFGNIGHTPIEKYLWTPSHKIETNVLPYGSSFQFVYMGVEIWSNHVA